MLCHLYEEDNFCHLLLAFSWSQITFKELDRLPKEPILSFAPNAVIMAKTQWVLAILTAKELRGLLSMEKIAPWSSVQGKNSLPVEQIISPLAYIPTDMKGINISDRTACHAMVSIILKG